jgi:hypothetical protein
MRIPQSGLKIDSPAFPLLQASVAYWGVTSGVGNALGTTLVCADLDNHPTYVGNTIKILSGGAWGQDRPIRAHAAGGILTVANPFTNAAGAAQQIAPNTLFVILSNLGGSGVSPGPPSPSVGLWMFGICDPGMAGSTTTIVCPNLAGLPDDIFNDDFYMEILRNDNNVGLPPEHEIQLITGYVGGSGTFTTDAFSANVEADDLVAIIHHSLIGPELNVISSLIRAVFDIVNASLVTTETGGTLTADGTEQDVYINNAPPNVYEPRRVKIDLDNMAVGDTVVVRLYDRIVPGGGLQQVDEITFNGPDGGLPNNNKAIYVDLSENRYGVQVTLEQTAGVNRDYDWEAIYRG